MAPSEYLPWVIATIGVGGFLLNIIIQIRGGAWNQAERENRTRTELALAISASTASNTQSIDKLRSETTHNMASLNMDLDKARAESQEQHNDAMVKFGDTIAAIKQKVNDDALHAERTFMRREEHTAHATEHRRSFDTLDRKMDDRFNRIEQLLFSGAIKIPPTSRTRAD